MKNYLNQGNAPSLSFENLNAFASPIPDPVNNKIAEGIPVLKLNDVYETIGLYKKLIAISILANTIVIIIGAIYL
jgi:hypothetical protein